MKLKTHLFLVASAVLLAGVLLAAPILYDGDTPGTVGVDEPEHPSITQSNSGPESDNGTAPSDKSPDRESRIENGTEETEGSSAKSKNHEKPLVNETPTEKRYVSKYSRRSSPLWIPEETEDLSETDVRAYEVTRYPNVRPTEEHLEAAWSLYNRSYEVARERGFFEFNDSAKAGYKKHDMYHYLNSEYYFNDDGLNPRQPEGLVYFKNFSNKEDDEKILAGYVYFAGGLETEGKQVAGPLTTWHYHPQDELQCFASRLNKGEEFDDHGCSENEVMKYRSPEMIHVWFIEHPEGPFSTSMGSFDWATGVFKEVNESDGVPEKMSKEKFKRYAENRYKKFFRSE